MGGAPRDFPLLGCVTTRAPSVRAHDEDARRITYNPSTKGEVMRPNISKMIRRISPRLPEGQQSRARWFNTCTLTTTGTRQSCASASETPVFQVQPAFTLRSHSTRFSDIRTSRPVQIDLSLFKTFTLKEGVALQFRAEAFNFANTPWFGGPNTTAGSQNFGVVTPSQVNDQRNVQLALKLVF